MEFEVGEQSGYLSSLRDELYRFFIERHIMLRPLGNVLYILPPYCIPETDLQLIYSAIEEFTVQKGCICRWPIDPDRALSLIFHN
jgi:adenosylmethionine-8-amino-7-oxononanoate aminotransferase